MGKGRLIKEWISKLCKSLLEDEDKWKEIIGNFNIIRKCGKHVEYKILVYMGSLYLKSVMMWVLPEGILYGEMVKYFKKHEVNKRLKRRGHGLNGCKMRIGVMNNGFYVSLVSKK